MNLAKDFFRKQPLSAFIAIFFIFLHAYNYSSSWMLIGDLTEAFVISFLCVVAVYFLLLKLSENKIKTGMYTMLFTLFFFYKGFFKTAISSVIGTDLQFRYNILIASVLFVSGIYFIHRLNESRVLKLNLFFNVLFTIYIIVDLANVGYDKIVCPQRVLELATEYPGNTGMNKFSKQAHKPNIYFLVFDEYSSSLSLKDNFRFDNSPLDSFLLSRGFFLSSHSKSNYTYTVFSISSTLNMNYFKNAIDMKFPDDFGLVWDCIYDNKVMQLLNDEGYKIYNFSAFNFKDHPATNENFSKFWAMKFVYGNSFLSVFKVIQKWYDKKYNTKQLQSVFNEFDKVLKNEMENPRFVYLHFLLPHHPYKFTKIGKEKSIFEYSKDDRYNTQGYLDQLSFSNRIIFKLIDEIQLKDKNSIIVLEGDHGNRFYPFNEKGFNKNYYTDKSAFRNLNAYYFFDKNYSKLNDSISPVNSFRVIFSQYFNKNYYQLRDSCCF